MSSQVYSHIRMVKRCQNLISFSSLHTAHILDRLRSLTKLLPLKKNILFVCFTFGCMGHKYKKKKWIRLSDTTAQIMYVCCAQNKLRLVLQNAFHLKLSLSLLSWCKCMQFERCQTRWRTRCADSICLQAWCEELSWAGAWTAWPWQPNVYHVHQMTLPIIVNGQCSTMFGCTLLKTLHLLYAAVLKCLWLFGCPCNIQVGQINVSVQHNLK